MISIPPYDVPAIDPNTGKWTPAWYDFMKSVQRMKTTDLSDVASDAPANTEVLIFNSTTGLYEPGAN